MKLPKDIEDIIIDYVEQINIHTKKLIMLNQVNNINRYEISLCKYCRCVRVKTDLFNPRTDCNHSFYLCKPLYVTNTTKILKQNVFNFYCSDCNTYGFFFSHLHYH